MVGKMRSRASMTSASTRGCCVGAKRAGMASPVKRMRSPGGRSGRTRRGDRNDAAGASPTTSVGSRRAGGEVRRQDIRRCRFNPSPRDEHAREAEPRYGASRGVRGSVRSSRSMRRALGIADDDGAVAPGGGDHGPSGAAAFDWAWMRRSTSTACRERQREGGQSSTPRIARRPQDALIPPSPHATGGRPALGALCSLTAPSRVPVALFRCRDCRAPLRPWRARFPPFPTERPHAGRGETSVNLLLDLTDRPISSFFISKIARRSASGAWSGAAHASKRQPSSNPVRSRRTRL